MENRNLPTWPLKSKSLMQAALLSIGIIVAASCSDPELNSTAEVESIVVSPDQAVVDVNQSVTLSGVYYNEARMVEEASLVWQSSRPDIASVSDGIVTGVSRGEATILAIRDGVVSNSVTVSVILQTDVKEVVLFAATDSLRVSDEVSISIAVKNNRGDHLEGVSPTWTSENESVLSVSEHGTIRGLSPGVARIYATVDGVRSNTLEFEVSE